MGLVLINFPSVPNAVGAVTQILNAKMPGSNGMHWSYREQGGVVSSSREYTNTMRVFTNSPFVGPIQIQQALIGIGAVQGSSYFFPLPELNPPALGSRDFTFPTTLPVEQDTGSFLHSLEIKQDSEDARQWLCTFSYGPMDIGHEIGTSNASIGSSNPVETAPEVHWTPAIYEEYYPHDINGKPFVNTVGDPIEDPPKRECSRQTLSFTRNEDKYNETYAATFRETLNLDNFLGFAPNQAKCKSIDGERIYTADYGYYWKVSYQFEFRIVKFVVPGTYDPETGEETDTTTITYGWEDIVLNAGFRQLDANGKPQDILVKGLRISAPAALNADGSPTYIGVDVQAQLPLPFYLIFQQYPQMDFSQLNIPANVLTESQ